MGCNIIINDIFSTIFHAFKKITKSDCMQYLYTTFEIFAFQQTDLLNYD